MKLKYLLSFTLFLLVLLPADALVISGEDTTDDYDRFSSGYPTSPTENPTFFRDTDNFHGVGWNKNNTQQNFALITPQHIVGANHHNPGSGTTLQFYNQSGNVIDISIASTATVQNGGDPTDVFVGELDTPLTASEVPFFQFPSDTVISTLLTRNIVPYGFPAQAGMNTVDSRDAISSASGLGGGANLGNTPTFEFDFVEGVEPDGQARVEDGDSGSPTFLEENGILAIAGTHSALASSTVGNTTTYISGDSDITRLIGEINTTIGKMGSTGYQVSQVPEPTALVLLILGGLVLICRRRQA